MNAGRNIISKNKTWNTPPKYIKLIKEFLGEIELDPCSNEYSLVSPKITYTLPIDGLKESWDYKTIFVNPPYGRDVIARTSIYNWIKKGVDSFKKNNNEILFLIPVATNTKHYKDLIFVDACGLCFLNDTRLKFWSEGVEDKKGAPMSCAIIYFGTNYKKFEDIFNSSGKCFKI